MQQTVEMEEFLSQYQKIKAQKENPNKKNNEKEEFSCDNNVTDDCMLSRILNQGIELTERAIRASFL